MMDIELDARDGGVTVVRSNGRLDMVAAPRLRGVISELVSPGPQRVVVDLSGTDFLDSSGLGALIAGLKSARQSGGDLRIACANEQVMLVLELTKLNTVLRPYTSVDEALHAE